MAVWPLVGLVLVAVTAGCPERAARLAGAIDALRQRAGATLEPSLAERVDPAVAVARAALGEEAFAAEWAAGRAMALEQILTEATALAREVGAPPTRGEGRQPNQAPHAGSSARGQFLTRREQDVLRLIAEGRTDQEIADALFLSRRTVTTHVHHILAKLGVPSRSLAVAEAIGRGFLKSPAGPPTGRGR